MLTDTLRWTKLLIKQKGRVQGLFYFVKGKGDAAGCSGLVIYPTKFASKTKPMGKLFRGELGGGQFAKGQVRYDKQRNKLIFHIKGGTASKPIIRSAFRAGDFLPDGKTGLSKSEEAKLRMLGKLLKLYGVPVSTTDEVSREAAASEAFVERAELEGAPNAEVWFESQLSEDDLAEIVAAEAEIFAQIKTLDVSRDKQKKKRSAFQRAMKGLRSIFKSSDKDEGDGDEPLAVPPEPPIDAGIDDEGLAAFIFDDEDEIQESVDWREDNDRRTRTALSSFLLHQQNIFREDDTQLSGKIRSDELYFTDRDGEQVELTSDKLDELGLGGLFTQTEGGIQLIGYDLVDEGIGPQARDDIAGRLTEAVSKGYDLHIENKRGSDASAADLVLTCSRDGCSCPQISHRKPASPHNLHFDRSDEVAPGSEPQQTFRQLMESLSQADTKELFQRSNQVLYDAFEEEKRQGKITPELTFLQYKLQFVDLEVDSVLESGLRWHDGSGALDAAEWAFVHLRVRDLPEQSLQNYVVEINWPEAKKPLQRSLSIKNRPEQSRWDDSNIPTEEDIYNALEHEGWSGGTVAEYRRRHVTVKLGYWDDRGRLSWEPTGEPAFVGEVTGQDKLLPLVERIPRHTLKALLTDVDGTTKDLMSQAPLDLDGDVEGVRQNTVDGIARLISRVSVTTWAENSGEAIGSLLQPIPDTQRVFLRQSNGTVNAIRLAHGPVRACIERLRRDTLFPEIVGRWAHDLEKLLCEPGPTDSVFGNARDFETAYEMWWQTNAANIERKCSGLLRQLKRWIVATRGDAAEADADSEREYRELKEMLTRLRTMPREEIGQTRVIVGEGSQDTGAFGKCAPTSFFAGTMCGLGTHAYDGLQQLSTSSNPDVVRLAGQLPALLTATPMDEGARGRIRDHISTIERIVQADQARNWNRVKEEESVRDWLRGNAKRMRLFREKFRALGHEKDADALQSVRQIKESIVDRMVVGEDADGAYFDMKFLVPPEAFAKTKNRQPGWIERKFKTVDPAQLAREHPDVFFFGPTGKLYTQTKVRLTDIQEYLEVTNREDQYRGDKKHMMDYFKNPSSMNNIQLMQTLGPGLIAVGLDKGLKQMGKASGLLYGPGEATVASMVYNQTMTSRYEGFQAMGNPPRGPLPMPLKGTPQYNAQFELRRASIVTKLAEAERTGGGISVSMGYCLSNGHVNYVQGWGTPKIEGVEISADDLARCRMNTAMDAGGSAAWLNDRSQDFLINPSAMQRGLDGIIEKLEQSGTVSAETMARIRVIRAQAETTAAEIDAITLKVIDEDGAALVASEAPADDVTQEKVILLGQRYQAIVEKKKDELWKKEVLKPEDERRDEEDCWEEARAELSETQHKIVDALVSIQTDDGYEDYREHLRKAAADTMVFLKETLRLDHSETMTTTNVVIMPSNTERDNAVSDNPEDRALVGGGHIGSQRYGSANACDGSYFVPVNALASGWNGTVAGRGWEDDDTSTDATLYNYCTPPPPPSYRLPRSVHHARLDAHHGSACGRWSIGSCLR